MEYSFEGVMYAWDARREDTWVFVSLPPDLSDEILDVAGAHARGFGSLRVEARIGSTIWRTSIFPGDEAYVLPLKKAVRRAQSLEIGGTVHVQLTLVDMPPEV